VYHLTLSFYGSACQHIEVSHGMKSVDQCSTAIQIQLDFDISRIAILLNISKHVLLPIQIVLVATILLTSAASNKTTSSSLNPLQNQLQHYTLFLPFPLTPSSPIPHNNAAAPKAVKATLP
jgi:hypothetical protein